MHIQTPIDRSPWRAMCVEALALASAFAVFCASALDPAAAPRPAHGDRSVLTAPSSSAR